jgi:alpha-tubulin suppressor-like RCC1 family protein
MNNLPSRTPGILAGIAALLGGILGINACGGGSGHGMSQLPDILTPVPVTTALSFTDIGVGNAHVCATATNGGTYCWGKNEYGVLGSTAAMSVCVLPVSQGGFPCTWVPVVVESSPGFSHVGGSGIHSCGLGANGSAYCWGFGIGGQLGDGARQNSVHPVLVAGGHAFAMMSVGGDSGMTCGVTPSGPVLCWGIGMLGDGTTDGASVPTPVAAPEPLVAVSCDRRLVVRVNQCRRHAHLRADGGGRRLLLG